MHHNSLLYKIWKLGVIHKKENSVVETIRFRQQWACQSGNMKPTAYAIEQNMQIAEYVDCRESSSPRFFWRELHSLPNTILLLWTLTETIAISIDIKQMYIFRWRIINLTDISNTTNYVHFSEFIEKSIFQVTLLSNLYICHTWTLI